MKFNPKTHIIGKVYDVTQANMNAMLFEIDRCHYQIERLKEALALIVDSGGKDLGQLRDIASHALED